MTKQIITKREFIKKGILGLCGITCGLSFFRAYSDENIFNFNGNYLQRKFLNPLPGDELWKWSKESYHYISTARGPKCKICPNECTPKEGELSDCRTKIAKDGKLYSIAYGNPCAVHIDPIEKKPFYHFMPASTAYSIATAGCNLACLNCQNWEISQKSPKETENYDMMPAYVVKNAIDNKCPSIAYTYSEPMVFYVYTYDTAKLAHEKGIKNLVHTAGFVYEEPLRDLCKYIDAFSVDLKSFSETIYEKLNAGKLQTVLNALKVMKEQKVWIEITNLVIPSWTDDLNMIKKMCNWLCQNGFADYPLHFSRFMPKYKLMNLPITPVSTLDNARQIALDAGLKFVYIGNVPGTAAENTYCPKCKKILIERKGFKILKNNIIDNTCKFCKEKIPGIWQ